MWWLASTEDNRANADLDYNINRHVEAQEIEEGLHFGVGSVNSSSKNSLVTSTNHMSYR